MPAAAPTSGATPASDACRAAAARTCCKAFASIQHLSTGKASNEHAGEAAKVVWRDCMLTNAIFMQMSDGAKILGVTHLLAHAILIASLGINMVLQYAQ